MHTNEKSLLEAQKAYEANVSPRARKLDRLERYAGGTQYEGRASFWNDDVPLQDRAPCIVVPIGGRAAESNVDLCLGEGRAPTFALEANGEDDVFDKRLNVSDDEAEVATRFIHCVQEQADLISAAQALLGWAQVHGTACAIVSVLNGRLCVDREDAKWCTPTFDPRDPDVVTKLEIRYPYLEDYTDDAGRQCKRCMLYRRVIDDKRDVTYKPAPASDNGKEPDAWIEDREKVAEHNLGFCPVRWYKFGVPSRCRSLDGEAIHAKMTDEIDALCFSYSQIQRAALYASDPQIIETGVDQDHRQAPMGYVSTMYAGAGDHPENIRWQILGANGKPIRQGVPATRRGPGVTWRYPQHDSKVDLLTLPGDALKPAEDNAKRLYALIKEMLGVVFINPEDTKLGSDISGRALEWLHSKQIDRCNRIRKDFARRMLVPVLHMLLRVALKAKGEIYLPGLDKARKILERFERDVEGSATPQWFGPEIRVTWGAYFKPTALDAKQDTENAVKALDAGLITKKTAVESLKPHYPSIGDVAQYLEALEEESEAKMEKFHNAAAALKDPEDDTKDDDEPASVPPAKQPKPGVMRRQKAKPVLPFGKRTPPPIEARAPKAKKPPVARAKKRVAENVAAA